MITFQEDTFECQCLSFLVVISRFHIFFSVLLRLLHYFIAFQFFSLRFLYFLFNRQAQQLLLMLYHSSTFSLSLSFTQKMTYSYLFVSLTVNKLTIFIIMTLYLLLMNYYLKFTIWIHFVMSYFSYPSSFSFIQSSSLFIFSISSLILHFEFFYTFPTIFQLLNYLIFIFLTLSLSNSLH